MFSSEQWEEQFQLFWKCYPRKEAKKVALKAWKKLRNKVSVEVITAALAWQRNIPRWSDPQYIPHASTYLNGYRWEDEPPPAVATQQKKYTL